MTVDKIVTWVIQLGIVDWVEFQDADSASDLEDSGSTSCIMWKLSFFGRRNCVPISCMLQEANVRFSQFHRIGNYCTGCCLLRVEGALVFVGCGDRNVTFVESHETINQRIFLKQKRIQRGSRQQLAHVERQVVKKNNQNVGQLSNLDRVTRNATSLPC